MVPSRHTSQVIPGLDGLRAISILCVIYAHLLWVPSFPWKILNRIVNPADLGVRVFFVISGFLITTLLLQEKDRTGDVSLKQFYFRRTLRIFPPYYFFLAVVFVLAGFHWITLESSDYWYTLTYTFNLKGRQPTWWVGHTWSLAVEEQFYLLWPVIVKRFRERTIQIVALCWFVAGPIGRALLSLAPQSAINRWYIAFPFVADPIAIGALLAFWLRNIDRRMSFERIARERWMWLVPLAVVGIESLGHHSRFFPHPEIYSAILVPLMDLGIAIVVAWATLQIDGVLERVLNSRLMVAIGILSYSLYLWQMLFLNPTSMSNWLKFPLDLIWVATAAVLSFTLIEQPFNRLRRRRANAYQSVRASETVPAL